ncbi:DUF7010 family protein [Clostridioides difficile]|uniref:DUF7010 family protein n=1 Tax=Clostridioides difficile TaxID=1496 RepID=UPI001F482F13|nr:hypothetical protein [Clostridioides difficile]MDL5065933.1 hypothetical protein [Clostridioides difficile]
MLIIQLLDFPLLTKNLLMFCCTAPLLPLTFLLSKLLKIPLQDKTNALNNFGISFSVNQMLYLLIAMWIYSTVPYKMLMVIVMVFSAHLLPYVCLYKLRICMIMSVIVPIYSLIIGCNFQNYILTIMMIIFETVFTILLVVENKKLLNKMQ